MLQVTIAESLTHLPKSREACAMQEEAWVAGPETLLGNFLCCGRGCSHSDLPKYSDLDG